MLCRLLSTSKSLHDHLLQPGSCRKLVVAVSPLQSLQEAAAGFGCWLRAYGSMLQALEVEVLVRDGFGRTSSSSNVFFGNFVGMGCKVMQGDCLRSLSVQYVELQPAVFTAPALKGLEDLHVTHTGPKSLLHLSCLTASRACGLAAGSMFATETYQVYSGTCCLSQSWSS